MGIKHYTPEEDKLIRENYGKVSVQELGEMVGRPWKAVHERARRLGLIQPLDKTCPICNEHFTSRMGAYAIYCSMKCAQRANYLKSPRSYCDRSRENEKNRRFKVPKTFQDWRPEEIRKLWEQYKGGKVPLLEFAKKRGFGEHLLRELFRASFPDEWFDETERRKCKSTAYQRGRSFEYRVRNFLSTKGYWILRSPQSKSPTDLVALKKGRILLIQCKTSKSYMKAKDWDELEALAESVGADAVLAYRSVTKTNCPLSLEYRNGEPCPL